MNNALDPNLDQIKSILESINDAIIVINSDQIITYCNPATLQFTQLKKEKLLDQPLANIKLTNKQDRSLYQDFTSNSLEQGKTTISDRNVLLQTASGQEIPVKVTTSPLFDPQRKIKGAVIALHDLSAEQDRLMIRSDFSYFQHQIGSPLSGILWNLQMAIEDAHNKEEKTKLSRIKNSMESLRVMTVKMLLASSLGQGLVNINPKKVSLAEILDPLLEEEKSKNLEKSITFKTHLPTKKITLTTDPEFLGRILQEILENARLYSQKDDQTDFVVSDKTDGLLFEVKDHGLGIPKNELSTVFTKFFRGVNIKEIPGAGLGLHIALQYAKLIKAKIWFTSQENVGTIFSVFVPYEI